MSVNNKVTCKGCLNRTPTCHSKCEQYLAFRAQRDAMLKENYTNLILDDFRSHSIETKNRRRRLKNTGKPQRFSRNGK